MLCCLCYVVYQKGSYLVYAMLFTIGIKLVLCKLCS